MIRQYIVADVSVKINSVTYETVGSEVGGVHNQTSKQVSNNIPYGTVDTEYYTRLWVTWNYSRNGDGTKIDFDYDVKNYYWLFDGPGSVNESSRTSEVGVSRDFKGTYVGSDSSWRDITTHYFATPTVVLSKVSESSIGLARDSDPTTDLLDEYQANLPLPGYTTSQLTTSFSWKSTADGSVLSDVYSEADTVYVSHYRTIVGLADIFTPLADVVNLNQLTKDDLVGDVNLNQAFGGNDVVHLTSAATRAKLNLKNVTFDAGSGNDTIYGGDADDFVYGNVGNDQLTGSGGNDRLWGGAGTDILMGLSAEQGEADFLNGGAGTDEFFADNGDTIYDLEVGERVFFGTAKNFDDLVLYFDGDKLYFRTYNKGTVVDEVVVQSGFSVQGLQAFIGSGGVKIVVGSTTTSQTPAQQLLVDPVKSQAWLGKLVKDAGYDLQLARLKDTVKILEKDARELVAKTIDAWTEEKSSIKAVPVLKSLGTPVKIVKYYAELGLIMHDTIALGLTTDEVKLRLVKALNEVFNPYANTTAAVGEYATKLGQHVFEEIMTTVVDAILSPVKPLLVALGSKTPVTTNQADIVIIPAGAQLNKAASQTINAADGDDLFIPMAASSLTIDGGAGIDTLSLAGHSARMLVDLTLGTARGGSIGDLRLKNVENVQGGAGSDTLSGNGGANSLVGGGGNDLLIGKGGADRLSGGSGIDTASYAGSSKGVIVSLLTTKSSANDAAGDSFSSVENIIGTSYADNITGDAGANQLRGEGGNDILNGGDGPDTLIGGAGLDKLYGGAGIDTASYAGARKGLTVSLLTTKSSTNDAAGDTFSSIENITGSAYDDIITGNTATNVLRGEAGKDTLNGGDGDDILIGGDGADKLFGGNGSDTASYVGAAKGVVANLLAPGGNTNNAAGDTFSSIENLIGTSYVDILTGNKGANSVSGAAGNDILKGDAGNDFLVGGLGADKLYGGSGGDRFVFKSAQESTVATSGRDTIYDFVYAEGDRMDLSGIDASTKIGGDQGFNFIGSGAFTGTAGQLRSVVTGNSTLITGDTNGDKIADFAIYLDDELTMQKGYFIL
ncbi:MULTISPECIES: calcium-binding protein [unclassified Rhizobium]|uniref:calcium-binding protein n=1 Tax=unclassified Rhizobium TaxID=2613769 RepID=UPI000B289BD0|nr:MULTISPECIES: calcium-binding protein [unclassified Rhizobium]